MKKFASLILTAIMLAAMLCAFAVPASADEGAAAEEAVFLQYYGEITSPNTQVFITFGSDPAYFVIGPSVVRVTGTYRGDLRIVACSEKGYALTGYVNADLVTPVDEEAYLASFDGTEQTFRFSDEEFSLFPSPCDEEHAAIVKSVKVEDGKFEVVLEKAVPYMKYGLIMGTTPGKTDTETDGISEEYVTDTMILKYSFDPEQMDVGAFMPGADDNASTLSEGGLTIIVGIACLAVGFLVAMFIFKKKKKPAASDE